MELTALARLTDGGEEYIFIGPWDDTEWLRPLLGPEQKIVRGPQPPPPPPEWTPGPLEPLKRALGPLRPVARGAKHFLSSLLPEDERALNVVAPVPNGFYESLGCDVIHFPYQSFVNCALPSIFNPHDLLHLHYPEFFSQSTINWREETYPAACRAAHTLVVASQFVKNDIVERYRIPAEKIQVISWAPPPLKATTEPESKGTAAVKEKHQIGCQAFALYPAMTWEHKNHLRLLEAVARLRDHSGLKIHLVCTGHKNDFWPQIEQKLFELKLEDQVRFLGQVSREDLEELYKEAQFIFIPTLFEAASAPLFEAWQHSVPVACSSVTSLPEQAGDAALLFDPLAISSIADALSRMATDAKLREELRQRGIRRLQDFSIERTAKAYRAVYRRAAGYPLNEEDHWLLSCDRMRGPLEAVGAEQI